MSEGAVEMPPGWLVWNGAEPMPESLYHLVKAAPDLLAALEKVLAELTPQHLVEAHDAMPSDFAPGCCVCVGRAAIAKAKGVTEGETA